MKSSSLRRCLRSYLGWENYAQPLPLIAELRRHRNFYAIFVGLQGAVPTANVY